MNLADKQAATSLRLACGTDIAEINAVRKHLSTFKGGGLARLADRPDQGSQPHRQRRGGQPSGRHRSGPTISTVADCSTWGEVGEDLRPLCPLEKASPQRGRRELADTPKSSDPLLARVGNTAIAGNRQALTDAPRALGYAPLILSSTIEGEARGCARRPVAGNQVQRPLPLAQPSCLISDGKTTVTLSQDHGKGRRNQEFALAAALGMCKG